jgi:hypothetical protein
MIAGFTGGQKTNLVGISTVASATAYMRKPTLRIDVTLTDIKDDMYWKNLWQNQLQHNRDLDILMQRQEDQIKHLEDALSKSEIKVLALENANATIDKIKMTEPTVYEPYVGGPDANDLLLDLQREYDCSGSLMYDSLTNAVLELVKRVTHGQH